MIDIFVVVVRFDLGPRVCQVIILISSNRLLVLTIFSVSHSVSVYVFGCFLHLHLCAFFIVRMDHAISYSFPLYSALIHAIFAFVLSFAFLFGKLKLMLVIE